jgi:hypothetical protein
MSTGNLVDTVTSQSAISSTMPQLDVPLLRYGNPALSDDFRRSEWLELGAGKDGVLDIRGNAVQRGINDTGWNRPALPLLEHHDRRPFLHHELVRSGQRTMGLHVRTRRMLRVWSRKHAGHPLFRYWNPTLSDHFYTTDYSEPGPASEGWHPESVQCLITAALPLDAASVGKASTAAS